MAVETKYKVFKDARHISTTGEVVSSNSGNHASFDTLLEAEQFLEASGSVGEYRITPITVKS